MENNYLKEEVQCPKCKIYASSVGDHFGWECEKCGNSFDTFEHFGKCPKCNHHHKKTQCLSCSESSNHLDFYPERSILFSSYKVLELIRHLLAYVLITLGFIAIAIIVILLIFVNTV